MRYGSACGLLIFMVASIALSADIYVSPTGSDGAAGTRGAPFATITRARDKADTLKSNGPVNVWLRGAPPE
jgi:hypothetical protein